LQSEPSIELLGEAVNLPQAFEMTADLKPNVVLMDLHLPGHELTPEIISSQLLLSTRHLLMMSLADDEEATFLAKRYTAIPLLDKSNLQSDLIPSILQLA
jgi:DNA-binding NarL/FixJ family response regulator